MRIRWSSIELVGIAALLTACGSHSRVVATVGTRSVGLEEIVSAIESQSGKPIAETSPDLATALFEAYLEEEVILASAEPPTSGELSPAARGLRARELLFSLCPPPPMPTDAEVDAEVGRSGVGATTGERLRIRQMILPDQSVARSTRERLRRGEDFAALSRELSRAPNAATGGLIGWVERGQLPPEFEAAVFGLAADELSEPVASNTGWHVFQVMERRGAGSAIDPATRERIRATLGTQRAETNRTKCVRQLATRIGVEVHCEKAPFPCRNPFEGGP